MSQGLLRASVFVVGLALVLATATDVVRTIVLPRGVRSRLTAFLGHAVHRPLLFFGRWVKSYETKDKILAIRAPVTLLAMLAAWLMAFLVGYALMLWSVAQISPGQSLREIGSSMTTLGFAASRKPAATAIDLVAAATGVVTVALQIAYLPVLYSAFTRRETLVTLLQSRAGSPPWGPEILARHQLVGVLGALPSFYEQWEQWAADVAESHSNYPVLVWFRSPHPLRSWIVGLLAVLDSAALYHSLSPGAAPAEARICLRMGFTCLRDIADALRIPFDPDPFPDDPVELTFEEFKDGVRYLEETRFPIQRAPDDAWTHFKGWRVNYESIAYALADRTVAVPAPWSGPRAQLPRLTIAPRRPADRRPEDPHDAGRQKGDLGL